MFRRYLAEFVGTFGIVFAPVACSAAGILPGGDHSLLVAALVSGLAVTAMIYAFGHISAAHFNPAVTLGFAVSKRFPWRYVVPYWIAQFLGGIAAAAAVALLIHSGYGVHHPATGSIARAVGMEIAVTFLLMIVVMAVATDSRAGGQVAGLAIGVTVVFNVLIAGAISGGSMNPARSLGPALFGSHESLHYYWIYLVGPFGGAVAAALLYEAIRGDSAFAKGAPDDLIDKRQ
jgi:MIP family channel proteins